MMFGPGKIQKVATMARNPRESDKVQALVTVLADREYRLLDAVGTLEDAVGEATVDVEQTEAERRDQLLDLVDAIAPGDPSVKEWWLQEVAGDHLTDPQQALPYLGMPAEEWDQQVETWAEQYHRRAPEEFKDYADREIAAAHVRRTFGVDLHTFEEEVVGWSRGEAIRDVLGANFEAVETAIYNAAETVEEGSDE